METATRPPIDTVVRIPIGELIVDSNIRKNVTVPPDFAKSVKQHGVLVPVEAYQADDNAWHLQDGQLRYLASVDAAHSTIPVLVADPKLAEVVRIERQLILNEQRHEISDADRAGAYQTLFELGVSADQIAKKTNTPKKRVDLALTVAASTPAAAAIVEYQLTLEEAAIFAEIDDNPEDIAALATAAEKNNFVHAASQIRVRRAQEAVTAKSLVDLEAEGTRIITQEVYDNDKTNPLERLYLDKPYGIQLTPENHKDCPGHAAEPGYGQSWGKNNERILVPRAAYVCTDWKKHGHFTYSSQETKTPLTETEKKERAAGRANSKLWLAATPVRVAFLQNLLTRKELPAGADLFTYTYIARMPASPGSPKIRVIYNLLQIDGGTNAWDNRLLPYLKTDPTSGPKIAFALALADEEFPLTEGRGWQNARVKYLERLSAWGYNLSDIEKAIVSGTVRNAAAILEAAK